MTDLTAVKERREAAYEWVFARCKGEARFRMTIPAQPDDTDTLLCNALKDSEALERELTKARAENARLRDAVTTTARALSTCEQTYRIGGRRETADVLRAVLRRAWATLRDTNGEANQ